MIIEKQQKLFLALLDQRSRSYCKVGSGYAMNTNGFQGRNVFGSCQKTIITRESIFQHSAFTSSTFPLIAFQRNINDVGDDIRMIVQMENIIA